MVIRLRITMIQCTGCGHVGWVEEKHLLCLHCLAHQLDKITLKSSPKTLLAAKIGSQLRESLSGSQT